MAASVTFIETMQSSLDPVQTIRYHDAFDAGAGGCMGGLYHSISRTRLNRSLSKRKNSDFLLEAPLWQRISDATSSRDELRHSRPRLAPFPKPQDASAFIFTIANHSRHKSFEFPPSPPRSLRGIKRCRPGSDVDGPNTAALNRKKRRLRSHLITSRLSQPFSQPATHILHRQGRQCGDRRFLKMASSLDVSRRAAHLQASSYLRFSVMNCLRRRFGIVKHRDQGKENDESPLRHGMDTSAKAPWQSQGARPTPESRHGSPFTARDAASTSPASTSTSTSTSTSSTTLPSTEPSPPHSHVKPPACRLSKPIALPLPSADVDAMNDWSSARIDSTPSPEPRPPLSWTYDDHEEDSFAFLYLDEENSSDEGSEHVYCDFDTLFGAKSSTSQPTDPQSPEEHTYEEYMDELDGISWRIG